MAIEIDGVSKGLLGAFTIFTLGSGIVSLVYGISLLIRYIDIEYNYGGFSLFTTSIVLIIVGGLLIVTALLGILGALKDISTLRMVTLILVFLLFATLAVIGTWSMVEFKTGSLKKDIESNIENLKKTNITPELKKKAEYLIKHYNCYISNDSATNARNTLQNHLVKSSSDIENTENKADIKKDCVIAYFQEKSKVIFRLAILTLTTAGATLLGFLLYAVVSQRARAGYAAVSRG